jgi:autotransporter adhesin
MRCIFSSDAGATASLRHNLTPVLAAIAVLGAVAQPGTASAQTFDPDTLVSVCSGVSLPPSVVTGIMGPVITGVVAPIEATTNALLLALSLPGPLNTNAAGLLAAAAAGSDISLAVVAQDGTLVGPSDECNAAADAFTLDTPAGIAIGGNAITGLGNGIHANAGEINSIAVGNGASTNAAALGSIALGTNATIGAGGTGSVALGTGSSATVANSVALGAGSTALRGPVTGYTAPFVTGLQNSVGEVSVGAAGAARQITNVAAGTAPTDAVNLSQLLGLAATIPTNAVQYNDATHTTVTFTGVGGTLLTNVAPGAVTATSMDAINGSQLFATNQQVANNTTAITNLSLLIGSGGLGPVQYSNPATPTTPNGGVPTNDVTLVGGAPGPVGLHNVAPGVIAAGSTDGVNGGQLFTTNQAVGAAQTTANTALVLGQNSVQYDNSSRTSVTLNPGGTAAVLHNVAAGVAPTDGVNVAQLQTAANNSVSIANSYTDASIAGLDFDINRIGRDARAGTSAALAAAGLPQAMDPGRSMLSAGVGTYRGKAAVAVGGSFRASNGNSVYKIGLTLDTSKHLGANAGVGFQFGGARLASALPPSPPPPPMPPLTPTPATQTCADGSVILTMDACPMSPPPPPAAPPEPERG